MTIRHSLVFLASLCACSPFLNAQTLSQINICKNLIIGNFASDPYGVADQLRHQAAGRGFAVYASATEVPSDSNPLSTCTMTGDWARTGSAGRVSVRVLSVANEHLLKEASASGLTAHGVVKKIYNQLGYTGFDENALKQWVQHEFPPRFKLAVSEDQIRKNEQAKGIEGIWSDLDNKYRIGIVPAPTGSAADFLAVILQSNSPLWEQGEIKGEFRGTASPDLFTCNWYLGNKKAAGTMFTLEHNAALRASLPSSKGKEDFVLIRVWPAGSGDRNDGISTRTQASGTGFPLNSSGLIATNWHVVKDAKHIQVAFPGWSDPVSAEVVLRDAANDLVVLRMSDTGKFAGTCPDIPFQLSSSNAVMLGEKVSAIGYPLPSLLGANPKYSEGVISSKSGLKDDPRTLQITAEVQPGSSGSPLFDSKGDVIGVIVATLDASKLYQEANALPQNVNWAIKSSYLVNLLSMLPDQVPSVRKVEFSPDKAAKCVAMITAW